MIQGATHEAVRYLGHNAPEVLKWFARHCESDGDNFWERESILDDGGSVLSIKTLECNVVLRRGDWLVKPNTGRHYVVGDAEVHA